MRTRLFVFGTLLTIVGCKLANRQASQVQSSDNASLVEMQTGCKIEDSVQKGTYYRKTRSIEAFSGAEGIMRVPEFKEDPKRYLYTSVKDSLNQPDHDGSLDRGSLYTGGHSKNKNGKHFEIDAGLKWAPVHDEKKARILVDETVTTWEQKMNPSNWYKLSETIVKVDSLRQPWREDVVPTLADSKGTVLATGREDIRAYVLANKLTYLFAFKPFVRTSNQNQYATLDTITKQQVMDKATNKYRDLTLYELGDSEKIDGKVVQRYHQWFDETPFFYLPGDEVKFSLTHDEVGYFTLTFDSLRTGQLIGFKFYQEGFDSLKNVFSFKRVTSIDQYRLGQFDNTRMNNAGATVTALPTQASYLNGGWLEFYLLTNQKDGAVKKVPMADNNCVVTRPEDLVPSYERIFRLKEVDPLKGREILDIIPGVSGK